jgi:hypothetical protein
MGEINYGTKKEFNISYKIIICYSFKTLTFGLWLVLNQYQITWCMQCLGSACVFSLSLSLSLSLFLSNVPLLVG